MTTAALSAPTPAQIEGANFLNLLIVDDERAIRDVCREVAQSLGFNTVVADSAEHAYRMLDAQSIDVVLLDLKLPGAGGLEALHQIRAAQSGCSHRGGDGLWHRAVGGASHEEWRVRLRHQALQHGRTAGCCWSASPAT